MVRRTVKGTRSLGFKTNVLPQANRHTAETRTGSSPGKLKRHNRRHNAKRLANQRFIHAGSNVLQVVSLHHDGNAAGDFHVFNSAPAISALAFGEGFCRFPK